MRKQKLPPYLQPMLVTLIDKPFDSPEWIFETKWDGFRMITEVRDGIATLYTRNGEVVTQRYKDIADAVTKLGVDCVIDGELVAFDTHGISQFHLLQDALRKPTPLYYCVFDLMFCKGKDLRTLSVLERKQQLREILKGADPHIKYTRHVENDGIDFFHKAQKRKEEGMVAKRSASQYQSGKRTKDWVKVKIYHSQEVVVVGYTAPHKSRKFFGSLVLAVREDSAWRYIGHVGTGFDEKTLKELYERMSPLRTQDKPFNTKIKDEEETIWLKPKLVVEVKFSQWTTNGELRHPSYIGIREDKDPLSVVHEVPLAATAVLHT